MNTKNYFTENEASKVLFRAANRFRDKVETARLGIQWLYGRDSTIALAKELNKNFPDRLKAINLAHTIPGCDIDLDKWVTMGEALQHWTASKEMLYLLSVRAEVPKVRYTTFNNRTLFYLPDVKNYAKSI